LNSIEKGVNMKDLHSFGLLVDEFLDFEYAL
jgi:hypothetical protein